MVKKIAMISLTVTLLIIALCVSVNAATYEPDGSSSTVYEVDSSESNRTLIVNCVDEIN